ncbi:thioredoxin family protein [Saccharibacillus endophyticus]|uniref:Thiol reductase thioredoxin n=1 Tax=Saccharibacillus endophyticus TaxID=2060666 RepID=A0ABQ1ZQ46_9BACL|nr:thioredoxin family protein [Saccharibacillus endophyticus]GGH70782.1 thiol reductase thioredoxin [Saccharibacillus endophyticus]
MRESTERELAGWIEARDRRVIVFGHTPFCGTCKAARRMLDVIEQMDREIDIYALDLNFAPEFIRNYRISSTPSLSIFDPAVPGEPRTIYAMHSVPYLLEFIGQEQKRGMWSEPKRR